MKPVPNEVTHASVAETVACPIAQVEARGLTYFTTIDLVGRDGLRPRHAAVSPPPPPAFAYIETDIPAGMTIAAFRRERAERTDGPTRRARLRWALSAQPWRPRGHIALRARVA
jgi:hypothetical protein